MFSSDRFAEETASVTDSGDGLKLFQRTARENTMEPDFTTGNLRYKARERYSFGFRDWRGIYGSHGAEIPSNKKGGLGSFLLCLVLIA